MAGNPLFVQLQPPHEEGRDGAAVEEVELTVVHGVFLVEGLAPLALEVDSIGEHQTGALMHGAWREDGRDELLRGLRYPAVDLLPCILCLQKKKRSR